MFKQQKLKKEELIHQFMNSAMHLTYDTSAQILPGIWLLGEATRQPK